MKIALYILFGIILLVSVFFIWYFYFFLTVPKLEMEKEGDPKVKAERIDVWLGELNKKNKFNGAILYAKEGKALLAKGYGFTNEKKEVQLTANSSMRLASVSKQFTATGIMLLKEKGRLNYDDLVSKYISDFPYKAVTVQHLLNQTSGVPDIYIDLAKKKKKEIDILTNEQAVALLVTAGKKADSLPNDQFAYSNTNYILLARIIELISGKSFEAFMQDELFEQLEMKNTRVWNLLSSETTYDNKADDFINFRGKLEPIKPSFLDGVAGDGAVFSSVNDLLIWDQFWYGNKLIGPENLAEAFIKPTLNNGEKSNYGFGWLLNKEAQWHNGAWLGANTVIIRNTKKKTCLVLLDNSSNLFFDKILEGLTGR